MRPERTWRIGDPGADSVCHKNLRFMDQMFDRLEKRCAVPDCGFPIKSTTDTAVFVPGLGEVCKTCHEMYTALTFMNTLLHDPHYFKKAHDKWVEEEQANKKKDQERRRRLGLDDDDTTQR